MNSVQLVGEVVAVDVERDTVRLAVPREGPHGREPGVVYVDVQLTGNTLNVGSCTAEGDRLSVVGYMAEDFGLVGALRWSQA